MHVNCKGQITKQRRQNKSNGLSAQTQHDIDFEIHNIFAYNPISYKKNHYNNTKHFFGYNLRNVIFVVAP